MASNRPGSLGPKGRPEEDPTSSGYAEDVAQLEARAGRPLTLENVACPGETVTTLLNGGDNCYRDSSQLERAADYLSSHASDEGLVTIDTGFNDLRPCIAATPVEASCVREAIDEVRADLPHVLDRLNAAAGPHVTVVGLTYGDPYLGRYLTTPDQRADALASAAAMAKLDDVLSAAYRAAHVVVAPVAATLRLRDRVTTVVRGGRPVPVNVAVACATTFECRAAPWGPDDHPNDRGYALIARTVVAALARSR